MMRYMTSEWSGRLSYWMETLKKDFYRPLGPIPVEGALTMEELTLPEAERLAYHPMEPGTPWGRNWEYCWMRGRIRLPEEAGGKRIAMNLETGGETTVYVDGVSFGTCRADWVRIPHQFIVDNCLTRQGEPGREYELLMEAYAGHFYPVGTTGNTSTGPVLPGDYQDPAPDSPRRVLGRLTYGIWNEEAYQLFIDMNTLLQLGEEIDPESLRSDRVAAALEEATLIVDFEQPPEERDACYRTAREALRPALSAVNGSTAPRFFAVGHAHLDLAWLWPMAETRRKTGRTFAAQLRHMEEYPEYRYIQSQPAAYVMCRERDPDLYERIREAVRRGQWIPEGAMWVEPDTNMTGGESLIRQVLHGKRFFREEFGVDSRVLWLPDTFGYSAALPQILRKSGIPYMVTQKIFWSYNGGEPFPYHYFTWQGADGSRVTSFLPTDYSYQTDPGEIIRTWKKRTQKRDLGGFLMPFGYGDGGGGPTRDHLEYLRREENLEGMPRVRMASPEEFFREMEAEGGPKNTYVGELYFSAHRGVFTSQADIKKGNRKAEIGLREAEMWGSLAMLQGWKYPMDRMDAAWKKLLLNQFHDILPGSSIARVYEEAREDHRHILREAEEVRREALSRLARGSGVTVFNSLSFPRKGLVRLPEEFAGGAVTRDGKEVPTQRTAEGVLGLVEVPACGAVSLSPCRVRAESPVSLAREGDLLVLENGLVRAKLNALGEVLSFVDLLSGREFAAGVMNRLLMFRDIPRKYDAWDIDSNYVLQRAALSEEAEIRVEEEGGLRAVVRVIRQLPHSLLEQEIILAAGSRRLDFATRVDWHELHRLLKVEFPVDVQAEEGINEIQFGYITRPTHRSRPYDSDRYEVCNQRYSALCDGSHGAAVLNDCKYGISMNGNALQLSLLRAPASPEMRADNGVHTFTYAFTAWKGSFTDSPVTREAWDLNVPLQRTEGCCDSFSAFSTEAPNVFIDTVKPAEDGSGDLILRLYEAKRADTRCALQLNIPFRQVLLCDMLENPLRELPSEEGRVEVHLGAFEVITLRLREAEGDREKADAD